MFSGATADGLVCSANTVDGPAFKRGLGGGVEVCVGVGKGGGGRRDAAQSGPGREKIN